MGYAVRNVVYDLQPYKAGKPIEEVKRELGLDEVIKLASNENPYGCSPKAKEAIRALINETQMYPDAANFELKTTIANKLGVKREQIFCGTGSDFLLRVICSTLVNPGDETIMGTVTFQSYKSATKIMGGIPVEIPMKDNKLDIEAMVNAITPKTKIIWFCNPNNPTGTTFSKEEFEKVLDRIPSHVVIIMDEAYQEFVEDKNFPDSISLLPNHPNMVVLRTFSKAYGLASLRCGYGIVNEELADFFNRIIGPFDTNLFAQKAAVAAFKDEEFLNYVVEENKKQRDYLNSEFEAMGLEYVKSNTNFIAVNLNRPDMPIYDKLLHEGMIIRPGTLLGMPGWIRVTIGTEVENRRFIKLLKDALK